MRSWHILDVLKAIHRVDYVTKADQLKIYGHIFKLVLQ